METNFARYANFLRPPVVVYSLLACSLFAGTGALAEASFETFLDDVAAEAAERGVDGELIKRAFRDLEPDPRVIKFDRNQPEHTITAKEYVAGRVTEGVVNGGRENMQRHADLLRRIEADTGVDARVVVAIWGIESRYGRYVGKYSVIRSLATLGHDPRRSAFFRGQLIGALQIAQNEAIEPEQLLGSWAGAMGPAQFMPNTWLAWARDGDGDGVRNLLHSTADVLTSIAGYLADKGWRPGQPWGEELTQVPEFTPRGNVETTCRALRVHSLTRPVTQAGVQGDETIWANADSAWRVYDNFRTLLEYNCANSYALAVMTLADRFDRLALTPAD